MGTGKAIGKHLNISKLAKGAQVINPACMIVMFMGKKHAVQPFKRHMHHLFPKIGATIDENPRFGRLHECRYAFTLISFIV